MNRDLAGEVRRTLSDPAALAVALDLEGAKRSAGGVIARCPAHADRTASCSITIGPDRTIRVCCFGCDLAGDALTLIAAARRLDLQREFPRVLEYAAQIAGIREGVPSRAPSPRRPTSAPPTRTATLHAIALPLLHVGRLDGSPIAADVSAYLRARGLYEEARRDGWASLPLPGETQEAWVRMLGEALGQEVVEGSGLVRGDAFVWGHHRLLIPWRTPTGDVDTIQRRLLGAGSPKYVVPSGFAPIWPFGIEHLAKASPKVELVFVEGAFDVLARRLAYRSAGVERVVLGLQGVAHWKADFARVARGRRVHVALDADQAGEDASQRIARDLYAAGAVDVLRVRPRGGAKDWAELAVDAGAA